MICFSAWGVLVSSGCLVFSVFRYVLGLFWTRFVVLCLAGPENYQRVVYRFQVYFCGRLQVPLCYRFRCLTAPCFCVFFFLKKSLSSEVCLPFSFVAHYFPAAIGVS